MNIEPCPVCGEQNCSPENHPAKNKDPLHQQFENDIQRDIQEQADLAPVGFAAQFEEWQGDSDGSVGLD